MHAWLGQHRQSAVGLGLTVDVTELEACGHRLEAVPRELADRLDAELERLAGRVYDAAYQNLSGSGYKAGRGFGAANLARWGLTADALLNVRSGRLRGALTRLFRRLEKLIENDVFYGALWEFGFTLKPWGREPGHPVQVPWMSEAYERSVGGPEGVREALQRVVAGYFEGGLL
jgi:hypothetical protein